MSERIGLRRVAAGAGRAFRSLAVGAAAVVLTVLVFLILPLIQQATKPPGGDTEIRQVTTVNLPPPPPPPPEEEEKKEEEPPPPQMNEMEAPPLDLSELELALNPGAGDGMGGDFGVRLLAAAEGKTAEAADAIFSIGDLDQTPRVVYQPSPEYPADMKRKKMQGTVHILFLVDAGGSVQNPTVQKSTHPAFERPALQAVRKWRFEPGKRNGQAVQFKMKVPVTFATG